MWFAWQKKQFQDLLTTCCGQNHGTFHKDQKDLGVTTPMKSSLAPICGRGGDRRVGDDVTFLAKTRCCCCHFHYRPSECILNTPLDDPPQGEWGQMTLGKLYTWPSHTYTTNNFCVIFVSFFQKEKNIFYKKKNIFVLPELFGISRFIITCQIFHNFASNM